MAKHLSDVEVYQGEKLIACYSWVSWRRATKIVAAALKRWGDANEHVFIRSHDIWHNANPDDFGYRI